MEPLYTYKRAGFTFEVYPNRIDIVEGAVLKKRESIMMRSVTDVQVTRTNRLRITTQDGRTREYVLGTNYDEARLAILNVLP